MGFFISIVKSFRIHMLISKRSLFSSSILIRVIVLLLVELRMAIWLIIWLIIIDMLLFFENILVMGNNFLIKIGWVSSWGDMLSR